MERKRELRSRILKIRDGLSAEYIDVKSSLIADKLKRNKSFIEEDNILIYVNYGSEVVTENLITYCISECKTVACPRVIGDGQMQFYKINSLDDLEKGYRGILEPKITEVCEPDSALVIIPGVAFDKKGYRIGYGKGFYDRYLNEHENYKTIALAYSCQIVDELSKEEHDIKMMQIITD